MVKRSSERIIRALGAAVIAAVLALFALPLNARAGFAAPGSEPVAVSSGVSYDPASRQFVYDVEEGSAQLRSSVLGGMVVSSPVTISGGGAFLYRNGAEYDGQLDPVSDPGEYVVMVNTGKHSVRVLTFTIVGKTTNVVTTYKMPSGMIVNEVVYNGEPVELDYRSVSMEREGSYRIVTECIASGTVYTLETTIDRTPPELTFEGSEDSRGRFNSAVRITGFRSGEKLTATRDGESVNVEIDSNGTAELVESGLYDLIAYDEAGNIKEYTVLITAYLNASGLAFVALVIIIAAAVIIYVLVRRRKLRIG